MHPTVPNDVLRAPSAPQTHMAFGSVASTVLIKLGYAKPEEKMTREVYLTSVLPIAALFSLVLWLGNAAYIYLSVSFIQMTKAGGAAFASQGIRYHAAAACLTLSRIGCCDLRLPGVLVTLARPAPAQAASTPHTRRL